MSFRGRGGGGGGRGLYKFLIVYCLQAFKFFNKIKILET